MEVIGIWTSKIEAQVFDFQLSTTFGEGAKEMVFIMSRTFDQKDFHNICPGHKTHVSCLEDTFVLARRRMCPGYKTNVG